MTYNIHSCRGSDGRADPGRIAEVIARCAPDIVALQEVDVARARSGGIDQATAIASLLRMDAHFHPALHLAEEKYGDAILTTLPSRLVKAGPLPSAGEPRGAIRVAVDLGGTDLHVVNTHLGLRRGERMRQAAILLGPGWLGSPQGGRTVLMGDLNAGPRSAAYRMLARTMADVQVEAGGKPAPTFPSRFPMLRLDHILVGDGIGVVSAEVPSDILIRGASDHLPLLATLDIAPQTATTARPGRVRAVS